MPVLSRRVHLHGNTIRINNMAIAKSQARPAAMPVWSQPQSEPKMHANFSTITFEGRCHSEIVDGQYGEYAFVSVITRLADRTDWVAITSTP